MEDLGRDLLGVQEQRQLRPGEFWALQDISFSISPGEVVGVIGQNGAGKSTLIKIISGIIKPTGGRISLNSRKIALIDSDGGLNPIQTGRENAIAQLIMHGHAQQTLKEELQEIESFADISDFFEAPVGSYSLGMRLRLAFAIYSRLRPDLFIIDEALGGGDEHFRNRFRKYLRNYIDNGGAMLLCSHEMLAVQSFCERCVLLNRGKLIMEGPTVEAIAKHHQLCQERAEKNTSKSLKTISTRDWDSDQACKIRSVSVNPGTAGESIKPGSEVVIEVDVAVREDIGNVACGIEIGLGEHIALATITGGYPDGTLELRGPSTRIICTIGHLPLAPGYYEVRVALSLPASSVFLAQLGYMDAPVALPISAPTNEITNVIRSRGNLVCISANWYMESRAD
jgi:lipopolysaccharide transport system ATP-binding protein